MKTITAVIASIQEERNRLALQVAELDRALASLNGIGDGVTRRRHGGTRVLSPAARRRIAAAQKARWAAWRKQRKAA